MFKFDGNSLGVTGSGVGFPKFKEYFGNDDRGFGYIRIQVRKTPSFSYLPYNGANKQARVCRPGRQKIKPDGLFPRFFLNWRSLPGKGVPPSLYFFLKKKCRLVPFSSHAVGGGLKPNLKLEG